MTHLVIGFMRGVLGLVAWSLIVCSLLMLAFGVGMLTMIPQYRKSHRRQLKTIEKYLGYVDLDGEENK